MTFPPTAGETNWDRRKVAEELVRITQAQLREACPALPARFVGILRDTILAADVTIAIEHPKVNDLQLVLDLHGDCVRLKWTRDHIDDVLTSEEEAGALVDQFPAPSAVRRLERALHHELADRIIRSTIVSSRLGRARARHEIINNDGRGVNVSGPPRCSLALLRVLGLKEEVVERSLCDALTSRMPAEEDWARPMPEHLL